MTLTEHAFGKILWKRSRFELDLGQLEDKDILTLQHNGGIIAMTKEVVCTDLPNDSTPDSVLTRKEL